MSMLTALLYIYLLVALIVSAYTEYVLYKTRRSDNPRTQMVLRKTDRLAEEANLNDHGLSVLMGVLWPVALYVLIREGR